MSLRSALLAPGPVIAPGAFDALGARLIERAGFPAVYLSGASVSYTALARPDLGLVTLDEMVERARNLGEAVEIPVIVDADTGHGNALNVARAVRLFERAGAAAVQLEDQESPKRCGHLAGKRLVGVAEMLGKLRAACDARRSPELLIVGRTDARAVEGLEAAIDRARRYHEAGADLIFVEAPRSVDELRHVAESLPGVPLVASMVEGGETPILPHAELAALGYKLILHPGALVRRFARAAADLLAELARAGSTLACRADMLDLHELNALLDLPRHRAAEAAYLPPDGAER